MFINKLKKLLWATMILTITMIVCLYTTNRQLQENIRGNLIFTTSENIKNIKKIEIENTSNKITLYEDDKIWRLLEEDNYYADFEKVRGLLNTIASAKVGNILEADNDRKLSWTTINVYDASNKKLGEAMISNTSDLGEHFVKYPKQNQIHISTWKMQLPENSISWVPQYDKIIEAIDVSSIKKQGITINRETRGSPFYDAETKRPYRRFDYVKLFDILANLQYDKVLSSQEFDNNKYPYNETIQIVTFDGLVLDLTIYSNYDEYWLRINISTTRLPSFQIKDYVEQNDFLFEDWWFRLPQDVGKVMFMLKL